MHLPHHRVLRIPEIVHLHRDRNEKEGDESSADARMEAEHHAQRTKPSQHTRRRNEHGRRRQPNLFGVGDRTSLEVPEERHQENDREQDPADKYEYWHDEWYANELVLVVLIGPYLLINRPIRVDIMDSLTEVFAAVHVSSAVQARIEASAPWGLERRDGESAAAYAYAHFAYVSRGSCYLSVAGGDPIALVGGDCVLMAPNTVYALRDQPGSPVASFCSLPWGDMESGIRIGGGGATTTIVNGWFTLGPKGGRFADLLPPMILIRGDQARSQTLVTTLQMLTTELTSPSPGSEVVVRRLADVLFIQALRAFAGSGSCTETPRFLRALADPRIGKSLDAMHRELAKPWTLATLASAAGMSRSAFA